MTDISAYTKEIAEAVYGEEVRDSIIGALQKVTDDNNSYQQIKDQIHAEYQAVTKDKADIESWLDGFDEKKAAGERLKNELIAQQEFGQQLKADLGVQTSAAQTAIQNAQATGSDLNTAINNGESTIADLQSANLSGQAMIDLMVSQTSSAQQVNSQLGDSLTTGTALSSALNATIQEGTACAETLSGLIDTAEGLGGSGLVIDLTDWGSPCGDPFGYACHNLELYNLVLNSLKKGVFPVIYYSGSYLQTYYAETTYLCGANGLYLYFHQKNPCGVPTYTSNLLIYDN